MVLPDQGRRLDLGTFEAVVLASGDDTDERFALLRTQREPSGFGPPLHRHLDAAEAFFVLEGDYAIFLGAEQHRCPPGSFVYVPRAVPHTFQVISSTPGMKLNLFTPAAMLGYFEELSEAARSGDLDESVLDEIAARSQVEVLGPVPDSYL